MKRDVEKERRMELRRLLGNRGFGRGIRHLGSLTPTSSAHACFDCRRSFKRADTEAETLTCPACGGAAHAMGSAFKPPPREKRARWKTVQVLYAYGFRFVPRPSADDPPLPERPGALTAFLEAHPDHPCRIGPVQLPLLPAGW